MPRTLSDLPRSPLSLGPPCVPWLLLFYLLLRLDCSQLLKSGDLAHLLMLLYL